jgi:hypothetical protein
VESIIQKEMESRGVKTEEQIEALRKQAPIDMLADMKLAISKKVDLNKQYEFGATYLHVAAVCGYTQVISSLCSLQSLHFLHSLPLTFANISLSSFLSLLTLSCVSLFHSLHSLHNRFHLFALFHSHSLTFSSLPFSTWFTHSLVRLTSRVFACAIEQVVQLLLEQPSVDPNIPDQDGNSPLHLAVFFQQYECVM